MSMRRVIAEGASFVCSVEKTRWPVRAAWIGDVRRLAVADFADQDDVGRLAHHGAEDALEVQADLVLDLGTG